MSEAVPNPSRWAVNWPRAIGTGLSCGFLLLCLAGVGVAVALYANFFFGWLLAAGRFFGANAAPLAFAAAALAVAAALVQVCVSVWAEQHGRAWPVRCTAAFAGLFAVLLVAAACAVVFVRYGDVILNHKAYEWQEGFDHFPDRRASD